MSESLRRACARMLMVGFPGTTPDGPFLRLVDAGVFGAILFKRNIADAAQTAALCRQLKERAGRPFLLAVDQEGGRVARLRGPPFVALPPMRALGEAGDEARAHRAGALLAYELAAVGFDWDFAPVVDVDTNPTNPVIGDRAFHRDPAVVARLAVALARGLEEGGVASCAKHFPGHGDTAQDSHLELPRLPHALERLRQVEWPPFRAYARAGLASVMTAHVVFDALDPTVPATMSARALALLRSELGFAGVLVSDDLEMKAIADHFTVERAVVEGARAGVDLFLVCHHAPVQEAALGALVRAVEDGELPRARVDEANARLDRLAHRFYRPPGDGLARLGSQAHRALAQGFGDGGTGVDPTEALA